MDDRPRVLLDVTRLLLRGRYAHATGIDRVVLAYARWLLATPEFDVTPVFTWRGRLVWPSRRWIRTIMANAMPQSNGEGDEEAGTHAWRALQRRLAHPVGGPPMRADRSRRRRMASILPHAQLAASVLLGRSRSPSPGSCYLNVGHSGLEHPGFISRLAASGVAPIVMIHDLIPIEFPEYCTPRATRRHARRLREALVHAHAILANSQTTEVDIKRYAVANGLRAPPIRPIYLGLEPAFMGTTTAVQPNRPPYFIAVGTIEPRKNIEFLLALWRQLAERLQHETPRLVIVGRRGWELEAIIDHLERSPVAATFVDEVAGLHDGQLADLMAGCRALLAPSFTEGFNLPVAEALAIGVQVIASDIPVHRELAREARLLNPLDGPGWLEAVERALREPAPRHPKAGPSWAEHFDAVGALIRTMPLPRK